VDEKDRADVTLNEGAVFKWVVIIGAAAAFVIAVTLLTNQLVGALLGLLLVIVGCVYAYRWVARKRRAS
jgi:hypothetical protein